MNKVAKISSLPETQTKPESTLVAKDDLKTLPLLELEKTLGSSSDGLGQAEAWCPCAVSRCWYFMVFFLCLKTDPKSTTGIL